MSEQQWKHNSVVEKRDERFVHTKRLDYNYYTAYLLDVGDLSSFVTVALATAAGGEDALTQDKLSHLRTVGTGFESVIYSLLPTAGYDRLLSSCQSLVKAIKKNKKLPTLLVCANTEHLFYFIASIQKCLIDAYKNLKCSMLHLNYLSTCIADII